MVYLRDTSTLVVQHAQEILKLISLSDVFLQARNQR